MSTGEGAAAGAARWWIARPGQQPMGPFGWDDMIAQLRAAGGVGDWMCCPEGGSSWTPLASNPAVVAAVSPAPFVPPVSPAAAVAPPAPSPAPFGSPASVAAGSDNTIPVLIHLGVLAGFIIPFAGLALPLVLWLMNREKPNIDAHGKEVVNWIIFLIIVTIPCLILVFCYIGLLLVPLILLAQVIFAIIGGVKASKGELFRYPMPFRLIK